MNDKSMTFDEIERIATKEIDVAQEFVSQHSGKREKSWDRYYGRPLGNEVNGRSQFMTRDLLETIEAILPFLIKLFASGDPKVEIEIKGQEPWVGKALMTKIQLDLGNSTPNLFSLFYQWFKDALISDTAFVKVSWDLDQENVNIEFDELPAEQMQQLAADPDVTIKQAGEPIVSGQDIIFTEVKAQVKKTIKDTLYAENTPHWEFLVGKRARSMNDEHPKGQKTEVTVDYLKRINRARSDKEPYFRNLDRLESGESKSQISTADSEKTNYMGGSESSVEIDVEKGPKAPVGLIEWYTRLDVDGDGYLEDVVCYVGNGHLLKWEKNEEGFIPFSALSPIIDCYKFFGISYSDLLVEIQNLKTMLFRRILDNFDFQNSGRWLKDPNANIDTYALLNNVPGSVITGKPDGLKDLTPAPFNPSSLSILEYVDTVKEQRTGVTRYNQGQDSDSLNKTATGISLIQNASMQRQELIGRIFAEMGLKDFYRKCTLLYQQYLRQPFVAKVLGQEKEITPEMIQGQVQTTVNMGVVASVGAEEADKIERVLGILFKVNEFFPGLLTPESVHNMMSRYITASGFNNVDDFIGDIQQYVQKAIQSQKQQGEMQNRMMEMEQRFKEMEFQIKGMDAETKAAKVEQDGMIAGAELDQEKGIASAEVLQKERDSQRDHELGLLKIKADNDRQQREKPETSPGQRSQKDISGAAS